MTQLFPRLRVRIGAAVVVAFSLCASAAFVPAPARGQAVVIAVDDFDRADEQPLQTGGNWEKVAGAGFVDLVGNAVVGLGADAVYRWQGAGSFDDTRQFARARVADPSGQVGLALLASPGNAVVAAWDASVSTFYLYWYGGGGIQGNLATLPMAIAAGDVIEAELLEGVIYARVNGAIVATVRNTTSLTTGRPGFEAFKAGGRLDDWQAGTPASYAIRGTILAGATGVADVRVGANGSYLGTTTTDANGDYTLTGVPSGATGVVVIPYRLNQVMSPFSQLVAGPILADVADLDFASAPPASLAIASDDFERANEVPLQVGGNWEKAAGAGTVDLSAGAIVGQGPDAVYIWQGPGTFDDTRQYARARVTDPSGQVGLALLASPGNAIVAAWDRRISTFFLYWYSGGVIQGNLVTLPMSVAHGDVIEAELIGGRIYARKNGTIVASAANTTTLTTGRPGFEAFGIGGGLDDWEAGTPPAYSISGTILENAVGLAGMFVRASGEFGATTTTDANGQYAFTNVPGGVTGIRITPRRIGHTSSPSSQTLAGSIVADLVGVDFTSVASNAPIVAFDDFDRPDELPLAIGADWARAAGPGLVNLVDDEIFGLGPDAVYFWQGPGVFDATSQYARARVVDPAVQSGIALLASPGNAIVAAWNGGLSTFSIYWYAGGVNQGNLVTLPMTIEAGDVIEAEFVDGRIDAKLNGTVVASTPNTTSLSTGRPGFEVFNAAGRLDDWEAGSRRVACDDGLDNDGDTLVDLADPGCENGADASEQNAAVACDDGLDNDGDTLVDLADPGCENGADASEQNAAVACDDGLDNDEDLLIDWPADPDCTSSADESEDGAPPAVPSLPPLALVALAGALLATATRVLAGPGPVR